MVQPYVILVLRKVVPVLVMVIKGGLTYGKTQR